MTNDDPTLFLLYILKGCAFIYYEEQLSFSSGVCCALPRCVQPAKPFNFDLNPHNADGVSFQLRLDISHFYLAVYVILCSSHHPRLLTLSSDISDRKKLINKIGRWESKRGR